MKRAQIAASPFIALNYWAPNQDTCLAECRATWAFDDAKLLQAMLKGQTMVVKGTPAKGEATADTYSLDGVTKAYQEMSKACGVKS